MLVPPGADRGGQPPVDTPSVARERAGWRGRAAGRLRRGPSRRADQPVRRAAHRRRSRPKPPSQLTGRQAGRGGPAKTKPGRRLRRHPDRAAPTIPAGAKVVLLDPVAPARAPEVGPGLGVILGSTPTRRSRWSSSASATCGSAGSPPSRPARCRRCSMSSSGAGAAYVAGAVDRSDDMSRTWAARTFFLDGRCRLDVPGQATSACPPTSSRASTTTARTSTRPRAQAPTDWEAWYAGAKALTRRRTSSAPRWPRPTTRPR